MSHKIYEILKKDKAVTHLKHTQQNFLSYRYFHHWMKSGFALLLK